MSDNRFKSESRNRYASRETSERKNFVDKNKFIMNEVNFPSIGTAYEKKACNLDFKTSTNKVISIAEKKQETVPAGWIALSMDKNNKITREESPNTRKVYEESFHEQAQKVIHELALKWQKYKDDYNEMYGEGAYEEKYGCSDYLNESEYTSDSDTDSYSDTE